MCIAYRCAQLRSISVSVWVWFEPFSIGLLNPYYLLCISRCWRQSMLCICTYYGGWHSTVAIYPNQYRLNSSPFATILHSWQTHCSLYRYSCWFLLLLPRFDNAFEGFSVSFSFLWFQWVLLRFRLNSSCRLWRRMDWIAYYAYKYDVGSFMSVPNAMAKCKWIEYTVLYVHWSKEGAQKIRKKDEHLLLSI